MTLEEYLHIRVDGEEFHSFPGRNNYVSVFDTFKNVMEKGPLEETKAMTVLKDKKTYLNDHGVRHVHMVIDKVSKLLWNDKGEANIDPKLTVYECFLLLVAIYVHDAGHAINGRKKHEQNAREFLNELNSNIVGTPEQKLIYNIARAHSGKDDPIGSLEQFTYLYDIKIRTRLLAALLRLGDEMSDDSSRASKILLEKKLLTKESLIYHVVSSCLHYFAPDVVSGEIKMCFQLNKKQCKKKFKIKQGEKYVETYLLDEIYRRTFKTFQECLYYNRFVPDTIRINTVNVTVEFIDKELEPFFPTIKYRLKEKGYPYLGEKNVFDFCADDLKRDGHNLDGEYVKQRIDNKCHES
ncbi:MAG: hypothetical protein MJY68_04625 [Bacteroidaceae bacterium]|nr:hypothetical protein [Bacteroidaceae bacterium]